MLTKELEERMRSKHKVMHERSITASNMLERRSELEEQLVQYKRYCKIIEEEKMNFKQARAFLVNHQDEKHKKDSETIRSSMKLASSLVKQKSAVEPRFLRKPGLRPESSIVVTRNNHPVRLSLTEGTGVAVSISCLTILSVLQSTPYMKTVFFDELFAELSPSNSESVSKWLNPISDGIFQMIMIEQKEETFKHTNYREFRIDYDGDASKVTTYDIVDGVRTVVEEDKHDGE